MTTWTSDELHKIGPLKSWSSRQPDPMARGETR
jgi:hypothetical protein